MKNNADVIKDLFSLDNGNIQNISNSFVYYKFLFGDYEIKIINNLQYAIPKSALIRKNNKYVEFEGNEYSLASIATEVDCKTGDLLFSLLALKEKIKPVYSFDYIVNEVPEKYINQILKWCKRYGLPFLGDRGSINSTINNEDLRQLKKTGFSISGFISQLVELENAFFLYQLIVGVDNPNNRLKKWTKRTAMRMLESYFGGLHMTCSIDYGSCSQIKFKMFDLFNAALYQLMLYASNPTNINIKKCECCGQHCVVSRSNQKYCSDCSPQKAYKRRKSKTISE